MKRIIFFIYNKENERLLVNELKSNYEILIGSSPKDIELSFDLLIIDGISLEKMQKEIMLRRYEEKPLFLPVLLVTTKREIGLTTKHLWKVIDEIITTPIVKAELQARIAILLRARYYSIEIKNRLNEMEIFAHAIGHDLQSPVRAIEHFSEYIKQDCSEFHSEKCKDYCEHISELAKRIQNINESLYNFLKIGKSGINVDKIILSKVIEKVKKDLIDQIEAKKALIEVNDDIEFYADRNLIESIMRNLIQNAVLYSKDVIAPKIKISSKKVDNEITIEVVDNGIGIPEKDLENIFKMFYRLHSIKTHKGSGLGLSIVKKCVEMMNGKVWAESKVGEGSKFIIKLPYKPTLT